jgi:hypothetical protein
MKAMSSARPRSKLPLVIILLSLVVAALGAAAYLLWPRFESEPPQIAIAPAVDVLGAAPLEITITDRGAGLKTISVTLTQGGAEQRIAAEQFAPPVAEKRLSVAPAKLAGIKEGPAVLRVTARDASLARFFKGNETVLEKTLTLDFTPPTLELVADDRYVNFGGVKSTRCRPMRLRPA